MKRYTIAVGFDWKNSDDRMFDDNLHDETRYLMPVDARIKHDRAFVGKDDLCLDATYASREEAEKDFAWIKSMYDKWWDDEYSGNKPIFPDKLSDEFPDHCAEFIFPIGVEEVEVDEKDKIDDETYQKVKAMYNILANCNKDMVYRDAKHWYIQID